MLISIFNLPTAGKIQANTFKFKNPKWKERRAERETRRSPHPVLQFGAYFGFQFVEIILAGDRIRQPKPSQIHLIVFNLVGPESQVERFFFFFHTDRSYRDTP